MTYEITAAELRPLLSIEQTCNYLGVSGETMAHWRVSGSGPKFIKVNRRIAYDPKDIEDWLDARRVSSTSEGSLLDLHSHKKYAKK